MVTPVRRMVAWPQPTGTLWPSLPQVPGRHGEVGAHRVDPLEDLGPVADQVGIPQRLGDLAVLDQVGLVIPKTKSPVVVLTWPPPSLAT